MDAEKGDIGYETGTEKNAGIVPLSGFGAYEAHSYTPPPSLNEKDAMAEMDASDGGHEAWFALSNALRESDDEIIKSVISNMDTVVLQAGLLSIVLAIFNVASHLSFQFIAIQRIPLKPADSIISALWASSLMCSLATGYLALHVKQNLTIVFDRFCTSPRQNIRVRMRIRDSFRRRCASKTAECMPLLLQLALALFLIGLGYYLPDSYASKLQALGLCAAARVICLFVSGLAFRRRGLTSGIKKNILSRHRAGSYLSKNLRQDGRLDAHALIDADEAFLDDAFLDKVIRPCLMDLKGEDITLCLRHILSHRLDHPVSSLKGDFNFNRIRTRCMTTLVMVLLDTISRELDKSDMTWHSWMDEILACLWAATQHTYYEGRYIGPVIQQSLRLPQRALSHREVEIIRSFLASFLPFPDLKIHVPFLTRAITSKIAIASRELMAQGDVNPIELTRVVLHIASLQNDSLQGSENNLTILLSDLAAAIESASNNVSDSGAWGVNARLCLDRSMLLNAMFPGSVKDNLFTALNSVLNKERLACRDTMVDMSALLRADEETPDDVHLATTIRQNLTTVGGEEVVQYIRKLITRRLNLPVTSLTEEMNLNKISSKGLCALVHILIDALDSALEKKEVDWTPWMGEALNFVASIQHHSHFGGRRIGPAMPRSEMIISRLFTRDIALVREAVVVLSLYPGISGSMAPSSGSMLNIIQASRDVLAAKRAGPLEIFHTIMLQLGSMPNDFLRDQRQTSVMALKELASEIERLRKDGGLVPVAGRGPSAIGIWCEEWCRKLNDICIDFIDKDITGIINKVADGEYTV